MAELLPQPNQAVQQRRRGRGRPGKAEEELEAARNLKLEKLTVRFPHWMVLQAGIVMAKQGHPSMAHTFQFLVEMGLQALVNERSSQDRLEVMVARTDDMMLTTLTILNMVHDIDIDDLERAKIRMLEAWQAKRAGQLKRACRQHPASASL